MSKYWKVRHIPSKLYVRNSRWKSIFLDSVGTKYMVYKYIEDVVKDKVAIRYKQLVEVRESPFSPPKMLDVDTIHPFVLDEFEIIMYETIERSRIRFK